MKNQISNKRVVKNHWVYSRIILRVYDFMVYVVANPLIWNCPNKLLIGHFKDHTGTKHMDVGVGTGYLLKKADIGLPGFNLTLMDSNESCLNYAENILNRYEPTIIKKDVFDSSPIIEEEFDSISVNYVLHCLPGSMKQKCSVLRNLKKSLSNKGVVFGSTILGIQDTPNLTARMLMRAYNSIGLFHNLTDELCELETELKVIFESVEITVVGNVAVFVLKD